MPDPSWIYQTTGLINYYNPKIHAGTQPIRVINHMLIFMFQNTNSEFFSDILEQIEKQKLNKELRFVFEEEPIRIKGKRFRTPRVYFNTKEIELHESFLYYLWCCT